MRPRHMGPPMNPYMGQQPPMMHPYPMHPYPMGPPHHMVPPRPMGPRYF